MQVGFVYRHLQRQYRTHLRIGRVICRRKAAAGAPALGGLNPAAAFRSLLCQTPEPRLSLFIHKKPNRRLRTSRRAGRGQMTLGILCVRQKSVFGQIFSPTNKNTNNVLTFFI